MSSWNMLRTVKSASEIVCLITRLTDRFPEEEQYVMVPVLRDTALTILENTAIGMARLDHGYRYIALTNAITALGNLNSKFILCKRIAVMTDKDIDDLKLKCDILKHQLSVAINNAEFLPFEPLNQFE